MLSSETHILRRRRGLGSVLAVAVVALVASACAPAPRGVTPNVAALQVVNRTPLAQSIFVDGQRIGTVPPGARWNARSLPTRDVVLSAQAPDGSLTARDSVRLSGDAPVLMVLTAGDETLPEPPGLGALAVVNAIGHDVDLYVDGERVATLFADQRRTLLDIVEGHHQVEARTLPGGRRLPRGLDVVAGAATSWRVQAPQGTLRITNDWGEPAKIALDGQPAGTAPAGGVIELPRLFAGAVLVTAEGLETRGSARSEITITADTVSDWRLSSAGASVTIDNRADESLAIAVDGDARGIVSPLERVTVEGLTPGRRQIEVAGTETGMRFVREITLGSGEHGEWRVDPRFGAVQVVNATEERQRLYLDGTYRRDLAPGETHSLGSVSAGAHVLESVGATSRVKQRREIRARADGSERWEIPAAACRLVLHNRRDEGVRVYLDSRPETTLDADQSLVLESVTCGPRLVEATGIRSGRVARESFVLQPAAPVIWTLSTPSAALVVENLSGEALRPPPRLTAQRPEVGNGAQAEFRVPPGRMRVVFVGQDSNFVYAREVDLEAGASQHWVVGPPTGDIMVHNRSGETMSVSLDGRPVGVVASGEDLALPGLDAGKHTLLARGALSQSAIRWPFSLSPEQRGRWEIGPQLGRLRVSNGTAEPIDVEIDGKPWGRVEPGEVSQLGNVRPGAHRLTARGLQSYTRYATELEAVAQRAVVWQLEPGRGTVVVSSARDERHVVLVDGAPAGTSRGIGDPVTTHAPLGRRQVAAVPDRAGGVHRTQLDVAPDRTVDVLVPLEHADVSVVNDTPWHIHVYEGDHLIGSVEAGSDAVLPAGAPGRAANLRAVADDGRTVWRRVLRLPADVPPSGRPAAVWHLSAPERGGSAR